MGLLGWRGTAAPLPKEKGASVPALQMQSLSFAVLSPSQTLNFLVVLSHSASCGLSRDEKPHPNLKVRWSESGLGTSAAASCCLSFGVTVLTSQRSL